MNNRVFWGSIALGVAAMLAAASIGDAARRLPNIDGVLIAGHDGTAQQIASINDSGAVLTNTQGPAADDAAASGNPVPVGCKYNTTSNTIEDGDISYLNCDSRTNLKVSLWAPDSASNLAAAAPSDGVTPSSATLRVNSLSSIFNGTTYDRHRSVITGTNSTGTGIAAAGILAQGDDTSPQAITENQFGNLRLDLTNRSLLVGQYNGTTAEAAAGNTDVTVLASAARTATTASSDLTNTNGTGLHLQIEVTAIVDTPSVVCTIQGKASVSSAYYTILATAAITGVSSNNYRVFPGSTVTANVSANDIIPRVWRVNCVHADADSITYSISASVVG